MNKETLEKAAEKYADFSNDYVPMSFGDKFNETSKRDFIAGANYMAERMYSEEKVDLLVNELINNFTDWSGSYVYKDKLIEIHEQLKKK